MTALLFGFCDPPHKGPHCPSQTPKFSNCFSQLFCLFSIIRYVPVFPLWISSITQQHWMHYEFTAKFHPGFPCYKCLVFPFTSQRLPPPTPRHQQWRTHCLHTICYLRPHLLVPMDIPDIFKEKSKKIWQTLVIWHSKQVTKSSIVSCTPIS